jgi:hypothetical protein
MSIAQVEALYEAAITALDAGDYATAIQKAMAAKLRLGTTPNVSKSVGSGSQALTWNDASAIDRFISDCRRLQSAVAVASGGVFAQSPIHYQRAEESS